MSVQGFVLQPTYYIEAGRPVIHLYGRLESGDTFLVRDDRRIPHVHIAAADAERARRLGVEELLPSDQLTLDGRPTLRIDRRIPSDTPALRDLLHRHDVATYEADVRFAMGYLIERGIRGSLTIDGDWQEGKGVDRVCMNPRLAPGDWTPRLKVLSFDIETDPKASRLLSIALYGAGAAEVLLFCPQDLEAPPGAIPFRHERDLLRAFCRRVRELDPDVLTGWNVIDFDLRVLDRLAQSFGLRLDLGRGTRPRLRLRSSRGPWGNLEATVPGRVVLDGPRLLRGSFIKMDSYGLDNVARELLGHGKTLTGRDRARQIVQTFLHERPRFVEYNLTDARLVIEILEQLRLVELAVERSRLTGLPIDRVQGSIAAFDFLYLAELKKLGRVAPSVRSQASGAENLGGHVFEPEAGLYQNVLVCDFKSLYPSLIRTFQIDPLGFVAAPRREDDLIVAPNRAAFRREPGILPRLLDELFPRREAAKAAGDGVTSHAIKILMNSFYGVLGTSACRFYRPELASAITSFGRDILLWSKRQLESYGYRVLYGDTDSLFVLSGDEDAATSKTIGERLVARLNQDLAAHVRATWGVDSRLELEFERLYLRLLLPSMRHGRGGARKRYAGLVATDDGGSKVVFTGMEVVRRDWTELAKEVQRQLYERLFHDREVAPYLRRTVAELRGGEHDELLIYRKALRKGLDEYTATTPPHVAAARKLSRRVGRLIAYVMTKNGAEPAEERQSPIDHEHYVQKQVRPVAEPVLAILGLDFDQVIGDDAQLRLFDDL